MNCARASFVLLALCVSACGTVVSPDAMIGDGGADDVIDAGAGSDVLRSTRTAARPDSVVAVKVFMNGDPEPFVSFYTLANGLEHTDGGAWQEDTIGACRTNLGRFGTTPSAEFTEFRTFIRRNGAPFAECVSWNCMALMPQNLPSGRQAFEFRVTAPPVFEATATVEMPGDVRVSSPTPDGGAVALRSGDDRVFRWTNVSAGTVIAYVLLEDSSRRAREIECFARGSDGIVVVPAAMLTDVNRDLPMLGDLATMDEVVQQHGDRTVRFRAVRNFAQFRVEHVR